VNARKSFTAADQLRFAELSGDHNPLHVDALAARRTMFGRPLVHGIHLALWSLDAVLDEPKQLTSLKATFSGPVGVDEPVSRRVISADAGAAAIVLENRGGKTAGVGAQFAPGDGGSAAAGIPPRATPREPSQISAAKGTLQLMLDKTAAEMLFPNAARNLPPAQVALLLATTRLVGMECPGLHSIYYELSATFEPGADAGSGIMTWRVEEFDPRFGRVAIAFTAPGAKGEIVAFLRPRPQVQPAAAELRAHIPVGAFAGRRALVIGGSRGIGEVCAKMLALGGADVRLTYHRGEADAARVVSDIVASGGSAAALAYDVLAADFGGKLGAGWFPTHVYYFSTPPIAASPGGHYSQELFLKFSGHYVQGVENTHEALRRLAQDPFEFFYASSVYVDAPPPNLAEYASAKAAGEACCRALAAADPKFIARIERLPRLPTDQTANVRGVPAEDMAATMSRLLLR
jgi:hypothetical protein